MLFLLFQLDQNRYALDVREVAAVLPLVSLARMPQSPPEVAGILNYRGAPVPVIDLCQLLLGRSAQSRLHTRIVLVDYPDDSGGSNLLGLIAERATETVQRDPGEFVSSGVTVPSQGMVATDADGLTQWITVKQLLPTALSGLLFQRPVAH